MRLSRALRPAKRLEDALLGAGGRQGHLKLRSLIIRPRDNGEQVLERLKILAQVRGIERRLHKMVAGYECRIRSAHGCGARLPVGGLFVETATPSSSPAVICGRV